VSFGRLLAQAGEGNNGDMTESTVARVEMNGAPASVDDLRHLVQTNYGHFSAMRVEDGGVRGLDLHLARIEAATCELFGRTIDSERVRLCLRHAVAGSKATLSLRINIFSRSLDRERLVEPVEPDILITVTPASRASARVLRVKPFVFTRTLTHVKHVGTFPLFHYRRLAQQAGFDDAMFVDDTGHVEEGSVWNIGFFDGSGVVWPNAPQLTGVSMQLLQAGLAHHGIASAMQPVLLGDVGRFHSAFFTNSSTPVRMISCIGTAEFDVDPALEARLRECHDSNPPQPV
jgi:branched-subunit amino acid aminotransferase/4-amino-4-deoxychorismate lyase